MSFRTLILALTALFLPFATLAPAVASIGIPDARSDHCLSMVGKSDHVPVSKSVADHQACCAAIAEPAAPCPEPAVLPVSVRYEGVPAAAPDGSVHGLDPPPPRTA